jgi:hypothetical protein
MIVVRFGENVGGYCLVSEVAALALVRCGKKLVV